MTWMNENQHRLRVKCYHQQQKQKSSSFILLTVSLIVAYFAQQFSTSAGLQQKKLFLNRAHEVNCIKQQACESALTGLQTDGGWLVCVLARQQGCW